MSEGAPTTPLWTPSRQLWIRLGWDDGHKNSICNCSTFIHFLSLTYLIVSFLGSYCFVVVFLFVFVFPYAIHPYYSTFHLRFFQSLRFVFALGLLSCVCITQELISIYSSSFGVFLFCFVSQPFSPLCSDVSLLVLLTFSIVCSCCCWYSFCCSVVAIGSAHNGPHKVSWQY